MKNKRYNNILEKFISNVGNFDFCYELKYRNDNVTEQEFTEQAYKKIDLFIKYLYQSMCLQYENNRIALLCKAIQKILKDNLYNNNVNTFEFFCNIFQIPDDSRADYGFFPSFSYSFDTNLMLWGNDLVIQIIFDSPQGNDENTPVFQIRCHYSQMEGQYNEEFDEYFNSDSFLTTEDYFEYYGLDEDDLDEPCEDMFNISIVQLSYCNLFGDLFEKDELENNIKEFNKDMANTKEF